MSGALERGPFCQEISELVCATCPVLAIAEEKWQIDTPPDITTPFDASEEFKGVVLRAVHPDVPSDEIPDVDDKAVLSDAMHRIHNKVLAINPSGTDEDDIGFHPASESDEIVIMATDVETTDRGWLPMVVFTEEEFSDSAKAVLACLRRNQETACMEGVPARPRPSVQKEALPPQVGDIKFGLDVLRAIIEDGSIDDLRTKVSELTEVARALNEPTLSKKDIAAMDEVELRAALRRVVEYLEETRNRKEDN